MSLRQQRNSGASALNSQSSTCRDPSRNTLWSDNLEIEKLNFENLKAWILALPEAQESPHRFGGTEFQVGGIEFMHSHGPSFLDIRLSKADQAHILNVGEALHHRFAPQAGWVSLRLEKSEDLDRAKKIISLAYENAKKNLEEIRSRTGTSSLLTIRTPQTIRRRILRGFYAFLEPSKRAQFSDRL